MAQKTGPPAGANGIHKTESIKIVWLVFPEAAAVGGRFWFLMGLMCCLSLTDSLALKIIESQIIP